ncbi:unnamed protein product [Prunus armeniaca]
MVTPQDKSLKKMKFVSSAETEPASTTTIFEDSKSGRGISIMPCVVKRKYHKIKPVVEYNKRGKGCGPAHTEMQSYIGQGGKNLVLSSAAKKWKDFKEKLQYNHLLSRKGYVGLEAQLEETMPGVEIDRSTLWKKARQDKHGNILDPKVAEKAKLIDELHKQVSEGSLSVSSSNDLLTMALGPEHPGRESVRLVLQEETKKMEARSREETLRMEARTKQLVEAEWEHLLSQLSQLIPNFDPSMLKPKTSPCQNQSPKNPMSDKAICYGADVRSLHFEDDTAKNGEKQEEMKCRDLENQDEEKKEEKQDEENKEEKQDEEKHDEKGIEVVDYSKVEVSSSLQSLCRYVETTLTPQEKIMTFTMEKEVFGAYRSTFVLPEDITQLAGMAEIGATVLAVFINNMVGFIDPAQVSANAGSLTDRSRLVANRLQKTDGEQIFMMPYNPGRHWVLLIVRAKKETVYFLYPLPKNRVVDEEAKNMLNNAIKMYNSHIGRQGRKAPIWKTLPGTAKQPSSVECGYYVMRFMRDIIMDPSPEFEKTFAKGKEQAPYPQATIDEVRNE